MIQKFQLPSDEMSSKLIKQDCIHEQLEVFMRKMVFEVDSVSEDLSTYSYFSQYESCSIGTPFLKRSHTRN